VCERERGRERESEKERERERRVKLVDFSKVRKIVEFCTLNDD
jgi:hypothetical protein